MQNSVDMPKGCDKIALKDARCSCGKLLGRVQEGAAYEIKCPRCKQFTIAMPPVEGVTPEFMPC